MNDQERPRVPGQATSEERAAVPVYRQQIEHDLPELRRQAMQAENDLRAAAILEPSVSGQLRRVILESGIDSRELAGQTGLSPKTLAEFLSGIAALDSLAIDRLAALLKQQLRPIGG